MFGRGDLKYALLEQLTSGPRHGYELIKALEARAGGFYTPSAGSVYPTLQLLEDRGWVTSETVEGKRTYTITNEGRQALDDYRNRAGAFEGPFHRHGPGHGPGHARPELHVLHHDAFDVARLMRAAAMASAGDPERLTRLREILQRTRDDLNRFLGQSSASEPTAPATPEGHTDFV